MTMKDVGLKLFCDGKAMLKGAGKPDAAIVAMLTVALAGAVPFTETGFGEIVQVRCQCAVALIRSSRPFTMAVSAHPGLRREPST